MGNGKGWVSIYRDIKSHWIWDRADYFKSWMDILLLVNHKDNKTVFDGKLITIKRGETYTSLRKLSESWGWSRTKVNRFLELLEADGMIELKKDTKKTVIKVVNYDSYQDNNKDKKTQKSHQKATEKPQKNTNNNDNNDNNENKEKDIVDFFEEIWKSYPLKRGKGSITKSKTKLKKIYKLGDEMKRCIERYKKDIDNRRKNGFKGLSYMNGSTFFNSGYQDYLDKNYKDIKDTSNNSTIVSGRGGIKNYGL